MAIATLSQIRNAFFARIQGDQRFPWMILLLLGGVIFCMRLHTYTEPLESDLTTYAVIGRELLAGRNLYTDLWDHKPPAIHLTYALALFFCGHGRMAIFSLGFISAFLTLIGIYQLVRLMTGDGSAALWAAAFWTILCSCLDLQANQPNVEVFLNVTLVWAFYFLARMGAGSFSPLLAVLSGLLFFAASAYKQIALVPLAMASLGYGFVCWRRQGGKGMRAGFANLAIIAALIISGWLALGGYFKLRGSWDDFYEAVFLFNRYYGGNLFENLTNGFQFFLVFPLIMGSCYFLLPLVLLGITHASLRPWQSARVLFLGYLLAAPFMIILPGKYYAHYYQLWLVPLILGAGLGIARLKDIPQAMPQWVIWCVPLSFLVAASLFELSTYRLSAEEWSMRKYRDVFIASEKMGEELNQILKPDETFFQWGWFSGLYFSSHRRPPTGILYSFPLNGGPLKDKLARRLLSDLKREKPEIIVAAKHESFLLRLHPGLLAWIQENYRKSTRMDQGIAFWFIRRGGRLEKEWIAPAARKVEDR